MNVIQDNRQGKVNGNRNIPLTGLSAFSDDVSDNPTEYDNSAVVNNSPMSGKSSSNSTPESSRSEHRKFYNLKDYEHLIKLNRQ